MRGSGTLKRAALFHKIMVLLDPQGKLYMADKQILAAKILTAHGVRGFVKLRVFWKTPKIFKPIPYSGSQGAGL